MTHAQFAARRLAHQSEGLRDELVQRRAGGESRLQFTGLFRKFLVLQGADAGLDAVDGCHGAAHLFDESLITAAKYLRQNLPHAWRVLIKKAGYCTDRPEDQEIVST